MQEGPLPFPPPPSLSQDECLPERGAHSLDLKRYTARSLIKVSNLEKDEGCNGQAGKQLTSIIRELAKMSALSVQRESTSCA